MMWIHPIIQSTAMILAIYVLYMGIQRFRLQHLKIKCAFNWKLHVKLGKVVHGLWLVGFCIGLLAAWLDWGFINLTGGHFLVGMTMAPLVVVALITGLILQKPSGKRAGMALFHGTTNLLLFLLACYQSYSGIEVIRMFLMD